ncbi:MAG: hypothetical protein JRC68_02130 [Deltaproteobacteria bacterium]|nr:hypothetical protein [Deltaproteobacteria bacterium]
MTISSRRYLLPFEEVVKYLGFAKSVVDSKEFRGIKPKYLTTAESSGILKRYHLEETAIASQGRYTLLGCKQGHVLPRESGSSRGVDSLLIRTHFPEEPKILWKESETSPYPLTPIVN